MPGERDDRGATGLPAKLRRGFGTLFEPSETRLWMTIGLVLGSAILLLVVSFSNHWYAANFYPASSTELDVDFKFSEASYQIFNNGARGNDGNRAYGDGPLGDVMDRTQNMVGFGTVMTAVFVALLVAYYFGHVNQVRLVIGAWALGLASLVGGIAYFSLTVADAAVEEIRNAANANGFFINPAEPVFWGSQRLASGDLITSPGPGWVLAIVAVFNLAISLILLFQFPDSVPGDDAEDFAVDDGAEMAARDHVVHT